ncbi:metallophosphoesterase [Xylophilus sp. GOD-11R]|uniref:metallophosphoesterase family protein n=1 Tax=Xylophilus sp. GOD-11R TaxID=3089814 RepID=UPI00298D0892|nr:metallophosphoesterase [Xylophilus sp. GOD-11R]WPB57961.1 metallophosphoesterase [Xylophilus sp. GOD-11R]
MRAPLLLHLSDTHFGTEQAPVVAALERLVREHSPRIAVLSGDITQRATRPQFDAARAFVDRLGIAHWVIIPGNHDIPLFQLVLRAVDPYRRYRAAFGPELAPELDTDDWLVIGHKTTRRWRHENGELDAGQIARTAVRLRAAARARPDQLRVVVVHQPMSVPDATDAKNLIHGARAAAAAWSEAGADLVLGGHIHLPCVLPLQARGNKGGRLWVVQAGTAVSSRIRGGIANSVNLLRPDTQGDGQRACRVERWDYDAASAQFTLAHEERLLLAEAP